MNEVRDDAEWAHLLDLKDERMKTLEADAVIFQEKIDKLNDRQNAWDSMCRHERKRLDYWKNEIKVLEDSRRKALDQLYLEQNVIHGMSVERKKLKEQVSLIIGDVPIDFNESGIVNKEQQKLIKDHKERLRISVNKNADSFVLLKEAREIVLHLRGASPVPCLCTVEVTCDMCKGIRSRRFLDDTKDL